MNVFKRKRTTYMTISVSNYCTNSNIQYSLYPLWLAIVCLLLFAFQSGPSQSSIPASR